MGASKKAKTHEYFCTKARGFYQLENADWEKEECPIATEDPDCTKEKNAHYNYNEKDEVVFQR